MRLRAAPFQARPAQRMLELNKTCGKVSTRLVLIRMVTEVKRLYLCVVDEKIFKMNPTVASQSDFCFLRVCDGGVVAARSSSSCTQKCATRAEGEPSVRKNSHVEGKIQLK